MSIDIDISQLHGLSELEAEARLRDEGANELPSSKPRGVLAIAAEVVREPMFLLLIGGALIYFLLGDVQEGAMLAAFVLVVVGITFYQERKTERALEALRDLSSPRALVLRDGKQRRIAGRDVVRGDLIFLSEGDRVPADALLEWSMNLTVDESLLTGESVPVRKRVDESIDLKTARPGGDDLPTIYSGTLVVGGRGIARVGATGAQTELGRIGRSLQTLQPEQTPLQRQTARLVKLLAVIGLGMSLLVVVVYGLTRGNWVEGFLAGIALAMAMLPEEFPVVLTIFLALGAWRISRQSVLTRRVPAIEVLGAATVLCVDKTGTLTQNRMEVRRFYAEGEFITIDESLAELPETFHLVAEYAILASQRDPYDPMEKALKGMGERFLTGTEHLHDDWRLVREYPLSPELLALSHVWRSPEGSEFEIAAKGSPEAIIDLCHLGGEAAADIAKRVEELAEDGLRVLGVARALFRAGGDGDLPHEQHDFAFEFMGLVGFADPVRENVPAALEECRQAGIRVIMITGDYPATARSIARSIGLENAGEYLTGDDISELSDTALREKLRTTNICARVAPEQKLRIVQALKEDGHVVAMTGDGVNDAPALKAAHIGVAMGGRGTDVAREASSLVLLDDDFSSIVAAVRLGRRIYANLQKAMTYIIAIHIPIAGLSLIPVLLKWPLALFPVHIAFMELIIDPACSIVFEAEPGEKDAMKRPPRDSNAPLFSGTMLWISTLQGLGVLTLTLALYAGGLWMELPAESARAGAFVALILLNLGLILSDRAWTEGWLQQIRRRNVAMWILIGAAVLVLGVVLYVPAARNLFRFAFPQPLMLAAGLGSAIIGLLYFEAVKRLVHARR